MFRVKKEKTDKLEVVCRISPYDGTDSCVEAVDEELLRLVPPPHVQANRRGEPYVSCFHLYVDEFCYLFQTDSVYKFAHVFEGSESQRAVFERCGYDLVENLIKGVNSLLFAYGVTGSGKACLFF